MEGNPVFSMYDDKLLLRKSSPEKENFDVLVYAICSIEKLVIPNFIEIIGTHSLYQCEHLKQIEIPNDSKLRIIEEHAFDLTLIDNFIIPSSLEKVEISSKLTTICDYAFNGCSSLKQVTIPNSVTVIGNYSFSGCSSLKEIVIPSSVASIGNYAFNSCSSLEKFTIPSKVTTINDYTFKGCSSLKEIIFMSKVKTIGM